MQINWTLIKYEPFGFDRRSISCFIISGQTSSGKRDLLRIFLLLQKHWLRSFFWVYFSYIHDKSLLLWWFFHFSWSSLSSSLSSLSSPWFPSKKRLCCISLKLLIFILVQAMRKLRFDDFSILQLHVFQGCSLLTLKRFIFWKINRFQQL